MMELKRCPFCDGEAEIVPHMYFSPVLKDWKIGGYGVECTECHTEGWQHYESEEEAARRWNQREGFVPICDDFESILICAVRYSLGRKTYMPHIVASYVRGLLPFLEIKTLNVIDRDIAAAWSYGDDDIDKPSWMQLHNAVLQEIGRRIDAAKNKEN